MKHFYECVEVCNRFEKCAFWSYDPSKQECWLKGVLMILVNYFIRLILLIVLDEGALNYNHAADDTYISGLRECPKGLTDHSTSN